MRIAIFTETYLPDINGVVTHIESLKKGLEALGHTVLICKSDASCKKNYVENNILHCPAVRSKKLYNYSLASPVSLKRRQMLKQFKPDIIHIHTEFGMGLSGVFIAKHLKTPYVYTLHTMYDDYIYYVAHKPFVPVIRKASHAYFGAIARHASAVCGPSPKVQAYFDSCGIKTAVNVIPNPVDLSHFDEKNINPDIAENFKRKYSVSDTDTLCCFCGRLGKEKSVDVLLKYWALTASSDTSLKLAVFGDGPEKEKLIELSKALGIDSQVIFTGKIPHEELISYLCCCKMYITCSLSDTYSISMLEAMSAGLPVLALNDPYNEGQVKDGVNGYIFFNADEMYRKINLIRSMSHDDYLKFQKSIKESCNGNSRIETAKKLVSVYESAIKSYNSKHNKHNKKRAN